MTNPEYAIDFETTDKDPKIAKPVEVALYGVDVDYHSFIYQTDIPPETSAIHHIIDQDVASAHSWDTIKTNLRMRVASDPLTVLIAHNAEYEKTILGDFWPVLWVCTYKCALRIWPDAPNHKNETLRYWLGMGQLGRSYSHAAHTAMHDAQVTFGLYQRMRETVSLEQLIAWSELPKKFTKIPFGKHVGQPWDKIPYDYLAWIMKQPDMDADIKYNVQEELNTRKANYATHRSG